MHTAAEDLFDQARREASDTAERQFRADCHTFVVRRHEAPQDFALAARMCRRMAEKYQTTGFSTAIRWRVEAEWYEERGGISDARD